MLNLNDLSQKVHAIASKTAEFAPTMSFNDVEGYTDRLWRGAELAAQGRVCLAGGCIGSDQIVAYVTSLDYKKSYTLLRRTVRYTDPHGQPRQHDTLGCNCRDYQSGRIHRPVPATLAHLGYHHVCCKHILAYALHETVERATKAFTPEVIEELIWCCPPQAAKPRPPKQPPVTLLVGGWTPDSEKSFWQFQQDEQARRLAA